MERLGENATAFVHFIENGKGAVVQISQKKKKKKQKAAPSTPRGQLFTFFYRLQKNINEAERKLFHILTF